MSAFRPIRWARVAADVRALARGLIALGVKPGDRVALIAENRPEWLIADLAIMAVGAITVPAFSTNTVDDNRHVLTHSGARGVIISDPGIAKRVLPAAMLAPELNFLIAMETLEPDPAAAAALPQLERGDEPRRSEAGRRHRGAGRRPRPRRDLPASSTPPAPAACPRA